MGLTYPSNKICPKCGTGGYVWYMNNSKYVAKCTNCGHYFQKDDFSMCVLDGTPKPVTNADTTRAMTDEELAEWVWSAECDGRAYGPRGKKAWLDWLREEVNTDGQ